MKKVGLIICNYNKKDYAISCIESVLKQSYSNFDIYMVDNASTDGSADTIFDIFGDRVQILHNKENIGGSGGFNTGMRYAENKEYHYLILLDNDVILEENCIQNLLNDMEDNPDIGIMGCKILKMDEPEIIQEFAPIINYKMLNFELCHAGERDSGALPNLKYCDYVPACALIVRKSVIEQIGFLPEENFIYYDDIEWCVKCQKVGMKVAANAKAIVWHKGGFAVNPTTFSNYYLLRNKIKFFTTYFGTEQGKLPTPEEVEERVDVILRDVFEGIYSCNYKGYKNIAVTRMDAFIDAITEKKGKAEAYKIRNREQIKEQLETFVEENAKVNIFVNGYLKSAKAIIQRIKLYTEKYGKEFEIYLYGNVSGKKEDILGIPIRAEKDFSDNDGFVLHICNHIYKDCISSDEKKWIDAYGNMLFLKEDFNAKELYEKEYELFRCCFKDRVYYLIQKKLGVIL